MSKIKITIEKEFKTLKEAKEWLKEKRMLLTDYERKSDKIKINSKKK